MVDILREARAMLLVSLPYPPLPMPAGRLESDEYSFTGDDTVTTSHHIIARCIDVAATRGDEADNERRKKAQREVFQRFLHAMAVDGFEMDPPALYRLYCEYTRQHILTYFPGYTPPINFMPYGYVCKGDPTHHKLCEYMAGQSILFGDDPPIIKSIYIHRTFGGMLVIARDRLGHIMTEEEREALQKKEGTWIEEITERA